MRALRIIDTIVGQDKEGRFSLNDFHRAAGGEKKHRPAYWLATAQAKDLVSMLASESEAGNPASPICIIKGNHSSGAAQGTYAVRELIYAYAMWISPAFNLKVIRAFDAVQRVDHDLWQQMQALIAREVESKVRASFGSHLMLERKREIPAFADQRAMLEAAIQPSLLN